MTGTIILVVGARPNFMKIAPIYAELKSRGMNLLLLHTGQHYDDNMSKVFFDDLGMPKPDIYLGIGSGTHAYQTATVMVEFEKICQENIPSMVVVVGDVNSTLACSIVCAKLRIPCAHVEAGLRSFDRNMPEEINRIITDSVANILLTPSVDGDENLRMEGIAAERIFRVGNVMIDSLFTNLNKSKSSKIFTELCLDGKYALVTVHRPSNVDVRENFEKIILALEEIGPKVRIVFPMHPRTRKMAELFEFEERLGQIENIQIIEPVGYFDFISLISSATLVLTDSGGLQEETTALGIPCLTLRDNTERPITVTEGTNLIVGNNTELIVSSTEDILLTGGKVGRIPELWDGHTAQRIADVLINHINNR